MLIFNFFKNQFMFVLQVEIIQVTYFCFITVEKKLFVFKSIYFKIECIKNKLFSIFLIVPLMLFFAYTRTHTRKSVA